ncbi:MAG: SDR family oxidoreductase [Pirellula sp.]|jgi:NAD(P)-dependent dehydrogenase (short-subunit alcohol dehydrogenase family)|nr:SDR family oxidoreductase [Pirellula sp.]
MRFAQRVVVITGGAKGIGAGCSNVFAQEGGLVAILDRDFDAAQTTAKRLGDQHLAVRCDVADEKQIASSIAAVVDRFGQIDCLINNAGIHPPDTPLLKMPPEQALEVLRINFLSTYSMCYYALEHLKKTRGTIINVSSMTAALGQRNSTAYAASKGAQLSFTKSLALECADFGIRVNAILPSNVDTPLMRSWAASLQDPQAALERIAALQPIGRMADVDEMGRVCLFLATEDSSFITGQGLHVDGGASLDY